MRWVAKTSLGIDLSSTQISTTLVRKGRTGLVLAKAAKAAMPNGMIANGRIVDMAGFTRLLRSLKARHGLRTANVTLSLPPGVLLTRLVRLEENDPQRIRDAVAAEVRQYALLSGRKAAWDFRVVASATGAAPGRALVAAGDQEAVGNLIDACRGVGLHVDVIEPAVLACLRVCRPKLGALSAGDNAVVVLLRDRTVTTCLFRREVLELIRTKSIAADNAQRSDFCREIAAQVHAVLAFDQTDRGPEAQGRRVVLIDDGSGFSPEQVCDHLIERAPNVTLDVITQADLPSLFRVETPEGETGSLTAFGAATRSLDVSDAAPNVNLVPPEDPAKKRLQRTAVLTGVMCALLMLLTLAAAGFLGSVTRHTEDDIKAAMARRTRGGDVALGLAASQLRTAEELADAATEETEYLRQVVNRGSVVDWVQLLNDVRAAVPKTLWITELFTRDDTELIVQGLSRSSEDVHVLAEALRQSAWISKATPVKLERDVEVPEMLQYTVECTIHPAEDR